MHNALKEVKQDKPKDQIKIIDVGAGTGLIGFELKKLGYTNLCALDISAEMLKEAKKKEVYTEFICTSLNGQPIHQIESGQFDALICGGALIPGLIGSSAFVEMIRMVQTGGSFAGVYRGTGTDVFGESVLWLIVGLDAKESFSRSFKASVVEEICPQCFESFKRCKKKETTTTKTDTTL